MEQLQKYIISHTTNNTQEILESISSMICSKEDYIPLSEESILQALKLDGEFLVLKISNKDIDEELQTQRIKYLISQSLSIIAMYESDGTNAQQIEQFVSYAKSFVDERQNFIFGIKKVEELSNYPIVTLFSGILPINQLQMSIGSKLYGFIHADEEYFKARFKNFRTELSKNLGVPILPVFAQEDTTLKPMELQIKDFQIQKLIAQFQLSEEPSNEVIERYLQRLFAIYKALEKSN